MIPRRTDWVVLDGDRTKTALSYMDHAINIWVNGTMKSVTVYIGDAEENSTVRLALLLLRDIDCVAQVDLLKLVHQDYSLPPTSIIRMVSPGGEAGRPVRHFVERLTMMC